jgi:hypothetical protein
VLRLTPAPCKSNRPPAHRTQCSNERHGNFSYFYSFERPRVPDANTDLIRESPVHITNSQSSMEFPLARFQLENTYKGRAIQQMEQPEALELVHRPTSHRVHLASAIQVQNDARSLRKWNAALRRLIVFMALLQVVNCSSRVRSLAAYSACIVHCARIMVTYFGKRQRASFSSKGARKLHQSSPLHDRHFMARVPE